jgi:hypothetical protein
MLVLTIENMMEPAPKTMAAIIKPVNRFRIGTVSSNFEWSDGSFK